MFCKCSQCSGGGKYSPKLLLYLDENPSLSVIFFLKACNKITHELAKLSYLVNRYNLLMSPPNMLLETIIINILSYENTFFKKKRS